MATFVLLHGSFHAAWNWHKLVPLLNAAGHQAIALDLPGHGADRTKPREASLDRCVDTVLAAVARIEGPVILVAHSRNGIVISQAAERQPQRIAGLVYLAAYLVPDGKSMMEYALLDKESLVVRNVIPALSEARAARLIRWFKRPLLRWLVPRLLPGAMQSHRLNRRVYKEALYHDCADEITALAHTLLQSEPNWAGFTPLQLSQARFGSVPKIYIECLQDRAVTIGLQRQMQRETPCDRVYTLDSGHSPFFSQPGGLALILDRAFAPGATVDAGYSSCRSA
ncbi:alpha/beta fold hydrolase [Pseudoduganella sp. LjRoot289]|uniref:alpha/beta fold hydrolase n=1 Tax=Pseudoduganella sp. LjRoot289 TaxID=3342314 RepID=UPI003ED12C4E